MKVNGREREREIWMVWRWRGTMVKVVEAMKSQSLGCVHM